MKPLLCNTQVVTNILSGLQTQDRRPIKPQPEYEKDGYYWWKGDWDNKSSAGNEGATWTLKEITDYHPHQVGDILYVREAFVYAQTTRYDARDDGGLIWYKATDEGMIDVDSPDEGQKAGWKPSIHMPKWAARIFLEVTGARVERVQDISWYDCRDEGIVLVGEERTFNNREQQHTVLIRKFKRLWESLYPGSWERNDFVWITNFKRTERPK